MCITCGKLHPLADDDGYFEEEPVEEDAKPFDPDDTQEIPEYIRELVTEATIATMGEAARLDDETSSLLNKLREDPSE